MRDDLISRKAAIDYLMTNMNWYDEDGYESDDDYKCECITDLINGVPSAESERAKYIPDTKAIPSSRDCVDLSERVTATFYDCEHEEWSQKTVTIRDVLDSVCDEYTVLPSAQPERKPGHWEMLSEQSARCTNCGTIRYTHGRDKTGKGHIFYANFKFCPECGVKMEVEHDTD